jgi:hypothetical protein
MIGTFPKKWLALSFLKVFWKDSLYSKGSVCTMSQLWLEIRDKLDTMILSNREMRILRDYLVDQCN